MNSEHGNEAGSVSVHRASMNEVAAEAKVSHQTVSRVINNSPNVSKATRERVQRVIRQLNYRPSNSARALVTRHTKTIGFIAGGVNYYGPISTMAAIESVAREHGFYLSVAILDERDYTREAFEEVANSFLDQGVEAFIFLAPTAAMVQAAASANIDRPRIILTSAPQQNKAAVGVRFIGIDQQAAARRVIDYLDGLGHKKCIFFSGPAEWGDAAMRLKTWQQYSAQKHWEASTVTMQTWDAKEAYTAAKKQFCGGEVPALPTAIVTSNDLQAFGVNKALGELGIRVPQDVSVVGFDDMPGADFHNPALTTVRPDFDSLGRASMQELLGMLGISEATEGAGGNEGVGAAEGAGVGAGKNMRGTADLIIRESSGLPRQSV